MGFKMTDVLYYTIHMNEFKSIAQWYTWHDPVHERDETKEDPSLQICFKFLVQTSRSFSAVIQELHPELLVPVALFYLILRGLDTIEDDMTIPLDKKEALLRNFHNILEQDGWNFDGNGPNEKDRELLVQFPNVITEFKKIKPAYRAIIKDITQNMGNGMADYANNAEHNVNGVNTIEDYNMYCHYVAGLVGEGLTKLFVESKLANPVLLERQHLQESMGLFLQKTNIIRDVREDFEDKRRFWPKEIWSKYVDKFEDLFKPENIDIAMNCSSDMVLNAITHADECMFYLAGLKEQSVFNFAAIPQAMAIATLELVFRNPKVFRRNVKITKGQACQIMIESTQNHQILCEVFRKFAKKIHRKNTPKDPNFLKISIACGKIEQFIESLYPTQDPKALAELRATQTGTEKPPIDKVKAQQAKQDTIYIFVAVFGSLLFLTGIMIWIAYIFGARFDVAIAELMKGKLGRGSPVEAKEAIRRYDHGEL
ncbi:bifunctional farnesyl-diphosphate farnesyltransferase/squalene synthase [Xylographa carneopallida]|nr:bifunctional farnesyl-diphosphate farnesyltransferase/squalene synthase [Xylographa carneopallida]